jgi:glycerophosphoryl diester phosphodiesterase
MMATALLGTATACTRPTATPAATFSGAARAFEIIGHRGAAGLAPENTLASFSRACAVGVDGIELDVHLSADEHVVVHHDYALHPDLTRDRAGAYSITEPRPLLRTLPLPALREYDVGRVRPTSEYAARHPEQRTADGARIPTLDEVITLFLRDCAPPTRLVVEIKTDPTQPAVSATPQRLVTRTLDVLRARKVTNRTQIIAFDWRVAMLVHRDAPDMPTSILTGEGRTEKDGNTVQIGRVGASPWMGGLDVDDFGGSVPRAIRSAGGRNWSPNAASLTRERLAEAHRLGVRVYPYTVNDTTEMRRLLELGVDGITTDRPDLLRAVVSCDAAPTAPHPSFPCSARRSAR